MITYLTIDSVQIIELVVSLEENFNIIIESEELLARNYEAISNIVKFITDKLKGLKWMKLLSHKVLQLVY